jgi:cell filamentation protein, protein adenylyltransferase
MPRASLEQRLQRLDIEMNDLRERLGGLPRADEARDIWHAIWLEEAHHSTALEGNTLVLKQVEELLARGRAVGDKDLREYLEVKGYAKASQWVYERAIDVRDDESKLVTLTELRYIHELVVTDEWLVSGKRAKPGTWRENEIARFSSGMQPPPSFAVASEMTTFIDALGGGPPNAVHPIVWTAAQHATFERIHPFEDGNGRVGRLLTNLLLIRLGYPPAIILKSERMRYLDALAKADDEDGRPLAELFARASKANLDRFIYPSIAGPAKLVPLTSLTKKGRPLTALRAAAARGKLQHRIQNGAIYSSRNWVDDYYREKDPRGRKPANA